jgi:hypothetical protein
MNLKQAIQKFRHHDVDSTDWLYMAYSPYKCINLDSEVELGEVGFDEMAGNESFPPEFLARGLHATIDFEVISESIAHADELAGAEDDEAAADVIRYAVRFDRLPDSLGAEDPLGVSEQRRGPVYALYDSLGTEDNTRPCRSPACSRGSVSFSAFCRQHHCESVLHCPCPIAD